MFIKETKEVNSYERKSKYGKLSEYTRTRYILHYTCDLCDSEFTKIPNHFVENAYYYMEFSS